MNSNQAFRRSRALRMWTPLIFFVGAVSIFTIAYLFGPIRPGGYSGFYFFPWWILFPLFFFGLLFFAFRGCGWGYWQGSKASYYDPALHALRERFANGEITKEQYEQMRRVLEDS